MIVFTLLTPHWDPLELAMTDNPASFNPTFADWRRLPPVEQARAWEKMRPGTFEQIWREAVLDGEHRRLMNVSEARHRNRIEWFVQIIQLLRIIGALCAVIALVCVAVYYINRHAPTQGASVFGIGGIAIVGLFLGSNPNRLEGLMKTITKNTSADS